MSIAALLMIVGAGALHAGWNALTKRSSDQLAFCWGLTFAIVVIFFGPAVGIAATGGFALAGLPFMVLSGLIHIGYFSLLAASYRTAELGLAYPVSRGTGVLLIPIASVFLFNEAPKEVAWVGILLIAGGVIWLHEGVFRAAYRKLGWRGVISWFALANGIVIATYSLVDSRGVQHINPALYNYGQMAIACLGLTVYFLWTKQTARLRPMLDAPKAPILAGLGSFITYSVVLAATKLAPVAYVGPMREISIVFGVAIGARFLGEHVSRSRIAGAMLVVVGILTIKIAG